MKIRLKNKILLILLGFILLVMFTKDALVKISVQNAVKLTTGLSVKIDTLKVGFLFKRMVDIRGLEIFNPKRYADRVMVDIPEIYVDYDLGSALSQRFLIHDMRLHLKELVVIKNRNGKTNLESITLPKSESSKDITIGTLELKITRVIFRDYSKSPPFIKEFNLNINERFKNIDSLDSLARVILVRAVSTTVKNFIDYDIDALKGSVESILADSENMIGGAVGEMLRSTADKIKSIFNR